MTSETDLELLEEYLDGAMEKAAQAQLLLRVSTEPSLADALKDLQSQRALRTAVWKMLEPDTLTAQQLTWQIRGAMLDQQRKAPVHSRWQWSQWRVAGVGSVAAACMMIGFGFGRLGTGGHRVEVSQPQSIVSADGHATPVMQIKPTAPLVAQNQFVPIGNMPKISVPITNEYGQVVAWQTFDNPEQAKNFTEDLHKTHSDSNAPVTTGQIKTVGEQF